MNRAFGRKSCWETELGFNHESTGKTSALKYKEKNPSLKSGSRVGGYQGFGIQNWSARPVNTLEVLLRLGPDRGKS